MGRALSLFFEDSPIIDVCCVDTGTLGGGAVSGDVAFFSQLKHFPLKGRSVLATLAWEVRPALGFSSGPFCYNPRSCPWLLAYC